MCLLNSIIQYKQHFQQTVIVLSFLIAPSISLAGGSASHRIIIRIIQSNSFHLENIDKETEFRNSYQVSNQSKSEFNLHWQLSDKNKRISVSSPTLKHPGRLIIGGKETITLTENSRDITKILSEKQGNCKIVYRGTGKQAEPVPVIFTLGEI